MVKSAIGGGAASPSSADTPIQAGEFKAKCLELMDLVAETGGSFLITKRGRPVARLVPAEVAPTSIFDCAAGLLEITGDIVDSPSPLTQRRDRAALLSEALGAVALPSERPRAPGTLSVSEPRVPFAAPSTRSKPRASGTAPSTRSKRKK